MKPAARPAEPAPVSNGGRVFTVDSALGDDANSGLPTTVQGAASGAWRTMDRLNRSDIGPGDTVVLACGSVWRETLKLPRSGAPGLPIVVRTPAGGCDVPPVIDGAIKLAPSAWQLHGAGVYRASLAASALHLVSASTTWRPSHHPNQGYLPSEPRNPYLALAAAGNRVTINNRVVSTELTTGSDLTMPTGATLVGSRVRVRTNGYTMDDLPIAAYAGNRITLATPTTYAVDQGWGYLLTGALWMLDAPGEWYYDAVQRVLYAQFAQNAAPSEPVQAVVLPIGVDLENRSHVVIHGLSVRNTGLGVLLRRSQSVTVQNAVIEDIAGYGIDADGSTNVSIKSNRLARTQTDAINADGRVAAVSTGLTVTNNDIENSGVVVKADAILTLPRRSVGAIVAGNSATIRANSITNSSYIGILVGKASVVEDNWLFGTCTMQDDCGAIYLGGVNNNGFIRRNVIVSSRGYPYGNPSKSTSAQGIYIDDQGSGVTVEDNTVADADSAIQLHNAPFNTVRNNALVAPRRQHIWLQEDSALNRTTGDIHDNNIANNLMASSSMDTTGYLLSSRFAAPWSFANFTSNRITDHSVAGVARLSYPGNPETIDIAGWQLTPTAAGGLAPDITGFASSRAGVASVAPAAANLVVNGSLQTNMVGWSNWNATAPRGQMVRETCAVGVCLRYTAGGSAGIVSSPNFTLRKGSWYRLSVDVSSEQARQPVPLVVRRAGGDYKQLSGRSLQFSASPAWQRYTAVFQATEDAVVGTSSTGARVDFDGIDVGRSISLARLEVVPLQAPSRASALLTNAGSVAASASCPFPASLASLCSKSRRLSDNTPVFWPMDVAAGRSEVIYAIGPGLPDQDGDGIADVSDSCPGSQLGLRANAAGCAINQASPN